MSRVFLDTNIFIYILEGTGPAAEQATALVERMAGRGDEIMTSAMTLGEVLVRPMQNNNESLIRLYREYLAPPILRILPFTEDCAVHFARIRATDRAIKPPDAIQLACVAQARCDLFLTNDDRLSRKIVPGIQFITSLDRAPL